MMVVVFTATAVAVTVVAGIGLTSVVSNSESKKEKKELKKYVADGAAALATSDLASGKLDVGQSKTYMIGGESVTVTATDNSANVAETVVLSIDGADPVDKVKGKKTVAHVLKGVSNIWSYGVYSNGGFTFPLLTTSKVQGSVFFRNSISILGSGQITKDYKSSSSLNVLGLLNIGGAILTGVQALTYPSLSNSTYQAAADTVLTGNQTLNGYTFPTEDALVYVNGNLTFQGNVQREGTFYVTGTVTINGDVKPNKKFAIVTPNSITFNGSSSTLKADGYYFAKGTINLTDKVTCNGALVANAFSVSQPVDITWDKWATDKAANGQKLKLPDMWP